MKNAVTPLNQRLLEIIENDFERCEWFIVAANELMETINETIAMFKDERSSLKTIKDSIGKIGIGIGNVERCLEGVEDFYNQAVEVLVKEMRQQQ